MCRKSGVKFGRDNWRNSDEKQFEIPSMERICANVIELKLAISSFSNFLFIRQVPQIICVNVGKQGEEGSKLKRAMACHSSQASTNDCRSSKSSITR